jgi:hypothetical protein
MLPPVLEVFILWHPKDSGAEAIAQEIIDHFHGTPFTGLIGGAVEVFVRSHAWTPAEGVPRGIPLVHGAEPNGLQPPKIVAIVPLLGVELANAVQVAGPWRKYVDDILVAKDTNPDRIAILPFRLHSGATSGTVLGAKFGKFQAIASAELGEGDTVRGSLCRDLAQGLAQFLSGGTRLTAFISHTKRSSSSDPADVKALIQLVRDVIQSTRLKAFFDAQDLQPGEDWSQELEDQASTGALLALRTDLYPSREWCQTEVLLAKRFGMPVITLDAIGHSEERGSFLMDHVPRVPIRVEGDSWLRRDVYRGLNLLVDECLKRTLWDAQKGLAAGRTDLQVSWWAPHAPEPATLAAWLLQAKKKALLPEPSAPLRIIHPDPPLGKSEKEVLQQMLAIGGIGDSLDVMTPRQLAARGV